MCSGVLTQGFSVRVHGPGLAPIIIAKVSPPSKQTPPPPSTSNHMLTAETPPSSVLATSVFAGPVIAGARATASPLGMMLTEVACGIMSTSRLG